MPPDIEFSYNDLIFSPPAPAVLAEWRSPASPNKTGAVRLLTLIDSGADGSVIPQSLIDSLRLYQVNEVLVGGYDDEEADLEMCFLPVTQPIVLIRQTL